MEQFKKYFVYLDDGTDCFRCSIPAKSKEDATDYVAGNGEVVAVKDVTKDIFISADKVGDALKKSGFGDVEIQFIIRTLTRTEIAE